MFHVKNHKQGHIFDPWRHLGPVKPSDFTRTLDQLATDLLTLTDRFSSVSLIQDMSTLKQLIRLFKEQCVVEREKDSSEQKAVAKPNKDVPSDSLQNPSDPDAGYSNHKGKGYQAQVVENYVETNDSEEKKKQLSLITYIDIESADKHDANALLPAIEDLKKRDVTPKKLLADSLYGSNSNCEKAKKEHGVEVIAPLMPGSQKYFHLSKFSLDEQGRIISCPCSITPKSIKQTKKGFSVAFPSEICLQCESFDICPVKEGIKACYYCYKEEDIGTAHRRRHKRVQPLKINIAIVPELKLLCRSLIDEPGLNIFGFA